MRGHLRPPGSGLMHIPAPKDMPVPEKHEAFSGVPIIPPADGSPFLIGYAPESDLVLSAHPPEGKEKAACATIYWTSDGWIVVDGSLDVQGNITPGPSGVWVNGRRVDGYSEISANDVIRLSGGSFVFVDPHKTPAEKGRPLELGEPWLRHRETDGDIVATASFRGIIDKYAENQDRAFFHVGPDGVTAAVADGMGGHASGERAAEIARHAFQEARNSRLGLGASIDAVNNDIFEANRARHEQGGAVFACAQLHNDGRIEVRTVGDSEVFVMSLPADLSGLLRLDYWSTRPTHSQIATFQLPTLADGRVELGHERTLRMDPDSNIVDRALGLRGGSTERFQETDWIHTEPGRIYFAMPMSDGLSEQYANHEEMVAVVQDHISRTGDVSPDGVCEALMRDALLRCSLARMAYRTGRPFEITDEVFQQAYREMSFEMDGEPVDPPIGLPPWRYRSQIDADGKRRTYGMVPAGGTAYVVAGMESEGEWKPDPDVVNPLTGRLRSENPALDDHPQVVCRFKQDNISVAVAAFIRE